MTQKELQQIHARFFHPEKSPHQSFHIDKYTGKFVFDYIAKHTKRMGDVMWNSRVKGQYIKPPVQMQKVIS